VRVSRAAILAYMPTTPFQLVLRIRTGELEFQSHHVVRIADRREPDRYADMRAKKFYGEAEWAGKKSGDGYDFQGGAINVSVSRITRLSEQEAAVLIKYL